METVQSNRKDELVGVMMKILRNEKGIALTMVLVLSTILLAVMAALLVMLTSRAQLSGVQKRYYTASEAGKGGLDLTYLTIGAAAVMDPTLIASNITVLFNTLPAATAATSSPSIGGCTGTTTLGPYKGKALTGIAAKLNTPSINPDGTNNWAGCNTSLTLKCNDSTTYDLQFDFPGPNGNYRACSKIIDTVEGLVGADTGLSKDGTAGQDSGGSAGKHSIHTIEVNAENIVNPAERAKFSVLYLY